MGEAPAEKGCAVCETRNANLGATTKQTPRAGPEHERTRRTTPQRACTPKQQAEHGGQETLGTQRTRKADGAVAGLSPRGPATSPSARGRPRPPGGTEGSAGRPASAPKASRLEPRTSGGSRTHSRRDRLHDEKAEILRREEDTPSGTSDEPRRSRIGARESSGPREPPQRQTAQGGDSSGLCAPRTPWRRSRARGGALPGTNPRTRGHLARDRGATHTQRGKAALHQRALGDRTDTREGVVWAAARTNLNSKRLQA